MSSHPKRSSVTTTRRRFLQTTGAALAVPYIFTASAPAQEQSKNDRPRLGALGAGDRWAAMGVKDAMWGVGGAAKNFGDYLAICDVDADRCQRGVKLTGGKADGYEDYQKILERNDIDVVTIITPDHWHSKMAVEAMKAGKDIYCEKPLTLTIEEGQKICKVAKETGRVFQVGTQQRSEMGSMFLKAVAIAQSGRLGKIKRVTAAIGGSPTSGELPVVDPPKGLNWEKWLGQAPLVEYRQKGNQSRCHYEFRWWFEYSGGKMTDWGAHHIDIAQWAIGMDQSGPTKIEPLEVNFPVPMKDGYPTRDDMYNTPSAFRVRCEFPNGVELFIRDSAPDLGFGNGVMIEGSEGKILVNREKLVGKPVDELEGNPLPEDALVKLCKGKQPGDHMRNFFECVADRSMPISDVFTHHRTMTTCHLANIALRLNRTLTWNPETEKIEGDEEANGFCSRKPREGYEIEA